MYLVLQYPRVIRAPQETTMIKMHLSLNVTDLERSITFYEAFFGEPPHKVRPGYANFDLANPPLKFALNQGEVKAGSGPLDHLGFQVATSVEVDQAKTRLQRAGLATFDETDTTCCYARQDKIWVHDPDGNEWEVYVLTDDLLDDHSHDHAGNPLSVETPLSIRFRPGASATEIITLDACCSSDG
jgi:catechol 2,3-dioxygenase-like lactoylglutathione lyase family enzyme